MRVFVMSDEYPQHMFSSGNMKNANFGQVNLGWASGF